MNFEYQNIKDIAYFLYAYAYMLIINFFNNLDIKLRIKSYILA